MIIKKRVDTNTLYKVLNENTCSTDEYMNMRWQDRIHCDYSFYGDVYKDHFDLCRTNVKSERTGSQHAFIRGIMSSDENGTIINVRLIPNLNHIIMFVIAIIIVLYSIISYRYIYMFLSLLLVISGLVYIYIDYSFFRSFLDDIIKPIEKQGL